MIKSWDGTLSSTEFNVAACAFSEQWRKFNSSQPQWSWVPSPKQPWISHNKQEGYLFLENVIFPRLPEEDNHKGDVTEKEECSIEYEDEFDDTAVVDNCRSVEYIKFENSDCCKLERHLAVLEVCNDGPGEHHYDFHVVYSASYRVPVLYFRAYCNDGQPLSLDDIKRDVPVNSAQLLTRSKWTFMTQEEHPVLNRPWYTLHPCGTSEWMKLLLTGDALATQGEIPIRKYLVSWFSVVGHVFGLKIPLEMMDFVGT